MRPTDVTALQHEHTQLRAEVETLLPQWAVALAHRLPTAPDLTERVLYLYDRIEAVEMALASYDPQQELFLDEHPSRRERR